MKTTRILDIQDNEIDYTGTVCAMGIVVSEPNAKGKNTITYFGSGSLEDLLKMIEMLQVKAAKQTLKPDKKAKH